VVADLKLKLEEAKKAAAAAPPPSDAS